MGGKIKEHGSFKAAVAAFEKSKGVTAPAMVLDEPVLDYVLRRVGVPIEGAPEGDVPFSSRAEPPISKNRSPPPMAPGRCPPIPPSTSAELDRQIASQTKLQLFCKTYFSNKI